MTNLERRTKVFYREMQDLWDEYFNRPEVKMNWIVPGYMCQPIFLVEKDGKRYIEGGCVLAGKKYRCINYFPKDPRDTCYDCIYYIDKVLEGGDLNE